MDDVYGTSFYTILVSEYVFWFASYTKKQGGHVLTTKIVKYEEMWDKGQSV
jgi:hypothetical protein